MSMPKLNSKTRDGLISKLMIAYPYILSKDDYKYKLDTMDDHSLIELSFKELLKVELKYDTA